MLVLAYLLRKNEATLKMCPLRTITSQKQGKPRFKFHNRKKNANFKFGRKKYRIRFFFWTILFVMINSVNLLVFIDKLDRSWRNSCQLHWIRRNLARFVQLWSHFSRKLSDVETWLWRSRLQRANFWCDRTLNFVIANYYATKNIHGSKTVHLSY